jgi:hypothetical protein
MATQWNTFPIEFRGGLISNLSALQQGSNAVGSATILQNFEANKEGGYSKIRGFEKFSTSTVPGSGPILGLKVISSGRYVVARHNASYNTVYYYGTGTTWQTMANNTSTLTNGGKVRHVEFNFDGDDKVIFVDGVNYPAVYNTSGNTIFFMNQTDHSPDISGALHVTIFKNTAFYAVGSDLIFTAPNTVDDFSVANGAGTINVGYDITGMAVFREQLIVFTNSSIKKITGSTSADFLMSPITDSIGCIDGDTIQEVGGDIMYLAPDGIRLLSATDRIGDFALDVASDRIFKDASTFLSSGSIYSSCVIREKAQYRIFSYISSEQKDVARGLIATKFITQGSQGIQWSTTKGIKAYVADSRYFSNQEIVAFANDDGYVYTMGTGNSFDGSNIEAIYESPYMPIADPQIRKTFYKMTLYTEPTGNMQLDLNLKFDFDSPNNRSTIQPNTLVIGSTNVGVFEYGAANANMGQADPNDSTQVDTSWAGYDPNTLYATYGGEIDKVYNKNVIGSGKTIAIRIEDSTTNPTYTLDTAILEFTQEDRQ